MGSSLSSNGQRSNALSNFEPDSNAFKFRERAFGTSRNRLRSKLITKKYVLRIDTSFHAVLGRLAVWLECKLVQRMIGPGCVSPC